MQISLRTYTNKRYECDSRHIRLACNRSVYTCSFQSFSDMSLTNSKCGAIWQRIVIRLNAMIGYNKMSQVCSFCNEEKTWRAYVNKSSKSCSVFDKLTSRIVRSRLFAHGVAVTAFERDKINNTTISIHFVVRYFLKTFFYGTGTSVGYCISLRGAHQVTNDVSAHQRSLRVKPGLWVHVTIGPMAGTFVKFSLFEVGTQLWSFGVLGRPFHKISHALFKNQKQNFSNNSSTERREDIISSSFIRCSFADVAEHVISYRFIR